MGWDESSPYFQWKLKDNVAVAYVDVPEIRHPTPAQEFGADVFALFDRGGHKDILLDLTPVRYISSTGYAVLVGLAKRIGEAGGRIKVCGLHPDVQVGANIIGLGRVVETYAEQDEAVRSFAAPPQA